MYETNYKYKFVMFFSCKYMVMCKYKLPFFRSFPLFAIQKSRFKALILLVCMYIYIMYGVGAIGCAWTDWRQPLFNSPLSWNFVNDVIYSVLFNKFITVLFSVSRFIPHRSIYSQYLRHFVPEHSLFTKFSSHCVLYSGIQPTAVGLLVSNTRKW